MGGMQALAGLAMPNGMMLPEAGLLSPFPEPDWAQGAQGDWSGIVDYERAMRMTSDDVIACVIGSRNASATARRPLETRWRYHEALYHLRTDDPDKEAWQAQMAVPEVYNKVEVWLSQLQNAFFDNPAWFKTVNENKTYDDPVVRLIGKWIKLVQERSELVDALIAMWREAALLGSGCMAPILQPFTSNRPTIEQVPVYSDPQQAFMAAQMGMPTSRPQVVISNQPRERLRWRQRSIWGIYPDPHAENFYDGRFCCEVDQVYEDELEDAVKAGIYDSLEDIGEPANVSRYTGQTPWRLGISESGQLNRRQHGRIVHQGDIVDRDGYVVARNWQVVLINERAIVQMGPNPLWSGKYRWIWSTPRPFPNRVWGRSMVDAAAKSQHELTDLLNLGLDDAKYVSLGLFRWDSSLSGEPQKPESLAPGDVVEGKAGMLERMVFPSAFNTVFPMKTWLEEVSGKETQISEWADGRPSSRGRPSARQVMMQTAAGQAQTNSMVRRLEDNDITRALDLSFEYVVQFGDDFEDPRLKAVLDEYAPELGMPNPAQQLQDPMFRFGLLDRPFKIRVRGISYLMDRDSLGDRLMQASQIAMQMGLPPLSQFETFYTWLTVLGLDPEMIGLPPTPELYQQALTMPPVAGPAAGMPGGQPSASGPATPTGGPAPQDVAASSQGGPTMQGL